MKKPRTNTQLSFAKPKRAGRPAKVDVGIRHISREKLHRRSALHLTIKVRENKAEIKTKKILKALHHAIKRARLKRLKIIHYTLEYNHIHLLAEATNNEILHQGMQALGISLSKAINKIKSLKGSVYKHRYHLKKINSRRQYKNVIHYILKNGIKHKRTSSIIDPYNSAVVAKNISADIESTIQQSPFLTRLRKDLREFLDEGNVYYIGRAYLWG